VCRVLTKHGVCSIVAAVSPFRAVRDDVRAMVEEVGGPGSFVEVWVRCGVEECIRRDVKGMYAKALRGEIEQFTGVSDPYEEPLKAGCGGEHRNGDALGVGESNSGGHSSCGILTLTGVVHIPAKGRSVVDRSFLWFLLPPLLQTVLGVGVMVPLTTYYLDPADIGTVAILTSLAMLVTPLASTGDNWVLSTHWHATSVSGRKECCSPSCLPMWA
jgi:hypothetical protein